MTLLNILDDGTVYPSLQQQDLVIQLFKRKIVIGRFDRVRFIAHYEKNDYIIEPKNAPDLKADAIAYISATTPGLFGKQEVVYFKCPSWIAGKAQWHEFHTTDTVASHDFITDTFK
jgi:hypothetical protein